MYTGASRYAELEPTGIEFPNITVSMAEAYAQDFIKWHQAFIVTGDKESKQEKTGHIEFLDPTGGKSLCTIDLRGVGIHSLAIDKSEANAESLKRVKVELYVDSMELKFEAGFE
jgi:hypothetical protein